MINHRIKCIFVQVPKTASTSIRSIVGYPKKPHLNIIELKQQFDLENDSSKRDFASYYKFGFVRNPWDRVVSLYNREQGVRKSKEMSFEDFVRWIEYSSDTCVHPSRHRNQLDWFRDEDGNIAVDFIGQFESLEDDWALISTTLRIDSKLPHENNNKRQGIHYSEYYTAETRDTIGEKFMVDIEHFGYSFTNGD